MLPTILTSGREISKKKKKRKKKKKGKKRKEKKKKKFGTGKDFSPDYYVSYQIFKKPVISLIASWQYVKIRESMKLGCRWPESCL
jgi:hypothetical protein